MRRDLTALVGLKRADEMPGDGTAGESSELGQGLLQVVLAEVRLPGVPGRLQDRDRLQLADRQQPYLPGVAAGARRRGGYALAEFREVPGYVVQAALLAGLWKPSYAK